MELFCLIIEIVSEKIRKLSKMRNVIWIVMDPSCMLLRQLMGSCYHISVGNIVSQIKIEQSVSQIQKYCRC